MSFTDWGHVGRHDASVTAELDAIGRFKPSETGVVDRG
jgi:hypothetical protein